MLDIGRYVLALLFNMRSILDILMKLINSSFTGHYETPGIAGNFNPYVYRLL